MSSIADEFFWKIDFNSDWENKKDILARETAIKFHRDLTKSFSEWKLSEKRFLSITLWMIAILRARETEIWNLKDSFKKLRDSLDPKKWSSNLCKVQEWADATSLDNNTNTDEKDSWLLFDFITDQSQETIKKPNEPPRLPNFIRNWVLSIYFVTNENWLDDGDKRDLDEVLKIIKENPSKPINLEWYADYRWNKLWNLKLSQNRTQAIIDYILERAPYAIINVVAYGDTKSKSFSELTSDEEKLLEYRGDRRVDLSIWTDIVSRWLSFSEANTYLIDATWSMREKLNGSIWTTKWDSIIWFDFPKDSEIYTFTTGNILNSCSESIKTQIVDWWTPLYDSILELLKRSNNWISITVFTDWGDNTSNNSVDTIVKEAKKRSIKINTIWIWVDSSTMDDLNRISAETWWSYYIQKN